MTVTSLIDIGDLAAVGALILSPVIFWIGYRRQRSSNQLRISLELMDRILVQNDRFDTYRERVRNGEVPHSNVVEMNLISDVLSECEYFGFVIEEGELDRPRLIRRYRTRDFDIWRDMNVEGIEIIARWNRVSK